MGGRIESDKSCMSKLSEISLQVKKSSPCNGYVRPQLLMSKYSPRASIIQSTSKHACAFQRRGELDGAPTCLRIFDVTTHTLLCREGGARVAGWDGTLAQDTIAHTTHNIIRLTPSIKSNAVVCLVIHGLSSQCFDEPTDGRSQRRSRYPLKISYSSG